jgi:4-hydroxybenzoate polyprenyltransferase
MTPGAREIAREAPAYGLDTPTLPLGTMNPLAAETSSVPPVVTQRATLRDWVQLVRPWQWTKNAFVVAPLLFSGHATMTSAILASLGALVMFCFLASSIYVLNDIADRVADRAHPTKRNRPIAAGRISPRSAAPVGFGLLIAALGIGWAISPMVALVAASYLVLNVFYSLRFKHVVILDVFCIGAFFLLRLLGGTAAIHVQPSVWLLLCGGLLALYLGFAKRRHELVTLEGKSSDHRAVLTHYSAEFLDQMSTVLLSVTIVSYIMYTLSSETAKLTGGERLSYSTVFVLFGVFRYLYLVHRQKGTSHGGNPTETLLTDKPLLSAVLMWLMYCGWVVYRPF